MTRTVSRSTVVGLKQIFVTVLVATFFVSGFNALLYQVVWQRLLQPEFQHYLAAGSYDVAHMLPWIDAPPIFWTPDTPRAHRDVNTDRHPKDEYYLNN